jgi:tetratricopeptide (TPR) repeat protein
VEESNALSMARQWLMAGETERALSTVRRQLDDATATGRGLEHAQFDLAWVLAWTEQFDEAFKAFEKSHDIIPEADDPRALLYLRSLRDHGLLLAEHGRIEEACHWLKKVWEETGRLAGTMGPEQALLAEPLAQVLLSLGELENASKILEEAQPILAGIGHERLPGLLALRAEALGALEKPPFASMPDLTEKGIELLFQHLASRSDESDPVVMERVYQAGVEWLQKTLPASSIHAAALGTLAGLSGSVGDVTRQVSAIDQAIEIYRERKEDGFAIQALQGRALALAEAGDDRNSEADYIAALDQASQASSLPLMSQIARNIGRFLSDRNRLDEATHYYQKAIEWAREAAHPEITGKALTAWGLFLAHQGNISRATIVLNEAIDLLPIHDNHATAAKDHLEAMAEGTACVCLDQIQVMARELRRKVLRALPPRTARSVDVSVDSGEFHLELDLVRPLSAGEEAQLQRILRNDQ